MLSGFVNKAKKLDLFDSKNNLEVEDGERGANWEPQEHVEHCRNCDVKFDIKVKRLWKHHCRDCGGVVCEDCLLLDGSRKICIGCKRGEAAGEIIASAVQAQLEDDPKRTASKLKAKRIIDNGLVQMKNIISVAKDGTEIEEATVGMLPASRRVTLSYGSLYGEDGRDVAPSPGAASSLPLSGYFEIFNKSPEVFCVKLLLPGGDHVFETPRPSFCAGIPMLLYFKFAVLT
jgi:hypothetical protein